MSLTLPTNRDILVYIFQRGAADGLNALVPYADADYYSHRPTIAVPAPGNPGGAVDVDGFYGLHPALAPLKALFDAGDLALVHASGVPHSSRSHFAAQNLVERGVADKAGAESGWLGRHLSLTAPASNSAFRSVAISGNVPVSLAGANDPLAISNLGEFGFDQEIVDSGYPAVLGNLYQNPTPFSAPAQAALLAMDELRVADLQAITPANGAVYPNTPLGNRLRQAGQLIRSTLPVEIICLDSDGWDHHENLPLFIERSLTELANALTAFHTDMGSQMQRVIVLVHSEFGRRVAENASAGADHGTAGLVYLLGAGVNGGQVISDWPGLASADLTMGEDLRITTDLRTLLSELLDKRLGGTDTNAVFPGFRGPASVNAFL